MMQVLGREVSRRRLVLAGGLLLLVVVVVAGWIYATGERRRSVEIVAATATGDGLVLEVGSCGGDPHVTELEQTEREVRITVEAMTRPLGPGNDCLDGVDVPLDAPIGDRVLVDASTGQAVDVQRSG